MNIRKVETKDADGIIEIYNYYVTNTHHTFETEPLQAEEMALRIEKTSRSHPFLLAEDEGRIVGYAYATQFKLRTAYKHSSEVSIYVKNNVTQKGIGSKLYGKLFEHLHDTHIHTLIAGISLPNDPSIRFHEKLGFKKVAHFKEVGYKLGRWVDVGYWQLLMV